MPDSLVISDMIELMGGQQPSTIADCQGVIFSLAPGFDLSAPAPTSDFIAKLVTDGEVPVGRRASNRAITLPLVIHMAGTTQAAVGDDAMRSLLVAGREILSKLVNRAQWRLTWTREGSSLPTVFDCYRASAVKPVYNTRAERQGFISLEIDFPAAPYGRSDTAVTTNFQSPLAGLLAPPSPLNVDLFSSVIGTQWQASAQGPAGISASAEWSPAFSPQNNPPGLITLPATTIFLPSQVINSNPDFTQFGAPSSAGWAGFNGTVAATSSPPAGARYPNALLYTNNGVSSGAAEETAGAFTCVPDEILIVSGWIYSSVASVAIGVDFTNNGAYFSTQITTYTVTVNTWTFLTAEVTCPPGANGGYHRFGSATLSAVIYGQHCTVALAQGATYVRGNLALNLAAGYNFACAATGTTTTYIAAATNVVNVSPGDQFQIFTSGSPAQTQIFTVTKISPVSGGNQTVTFTPAASSAPTTSQNIVQTGPPQLPAVTVWAGFGSSSYFYNWARRGGPVHFLLTLTDTYGNTVTSSHLAPHLYGSNNSAAPKWYKIRIPLTYSTTFDYQNVAGYALSVTNRGLSMVYSQVYLSDIVAVPRTTQVVTPQRGVVYDLAGMVGSARTAPSFAFQQAGSSVTNTAFFGTPGTYQWQAPFGCTAAQNVLAVGGGGCGPTGQANGTGGGSAGSSGTSASVAVTALNFYTVVVGQGATPGGPAAGLSSFTGDSVTVTGPAGISSTSSTGAASPAAGTPSGFAGGAGGAGVASGTGGGGGGGSSGGSAGAGNPGGAASGSTGGTAAAPVTGGGPGARGGTHNFGNGVRPVSGYGGAAGGSPGGATGYFYPGYGGKVSFNYTSPPTFKTLLLHRPNYDTDPQFNPIVTIQPGDPVDGSVAYTMPQLTPGINARFGTGGIPGTFTVCAVNGGWNAPASSVTVTVTVTTYEQPGGNSYAQTVSWSFIPNNLPNSTPFVMLGSLTIPSLEIPPENLNAYHTVSITDSNTSDTWLDVIFLDTQGSTVVLAQPNAYVGMYVDEPYSTRDIGAVLVSPTFDRLTAVSGLTGAQVISGGPITIDPYGNQSLLAYCVEGAPNMQMTYYPRWMFDRTS